MCAIAGCISLNGSLSSDNIEVLKRLVETQRRRGPDGEGLWIAPDHRAALGHRRLAIIDVGQSGAQPMSDATGRWTLSFNGEIYNYRELRRELEAAGKRFLTQSDSEVLINAFAEWGEQGLRKLRGMYAFALWDDECKELWLARDPFGVKPLYYAQAGPYIWLASQARALARCAPVDTDRSAAGLVGFYLWGAVPDPFTWWQGVRALPAGHFLRIRHGREVPAPRAFVDLADYYRAQPIEPLSTKALHDAFVESLAAHFVADVPVGIFLSAGIDSTAIATVAKELGFNLRTVTLAFGEFRDTHDDEAPSAEETARRLGADHHTVHISRDEFYGLFDDFIESMDQPSIDGLNTFLVSRAAASTGLKVALCGLGADELLGGYPSFKQIPALVSIGNIIPGSAFLGGLLQKAGLPITRLLKVTPKLAASLHYSRNIELAYYLRRCLYLPEELDILVDETWRRRGLEELAAELPGGDGVRVKQLNSTTLHAAVSVLEVVQYMNMQLLRTTDWASMAHSLEVRVPFVDLPFFSKLAPAINSERPPLKLDLANSIGGPVKAAANRRKTGFTTPVPQWLEKSTRARGLRPWADVIAKSFATT